MISASSQPKPVSRAALRSGLVSLAKMIGLMILFGVAYAQSPLYTSNQNQYFLHGLAQAGYGSLAQDWLANTLDPTPVFSAMVFLVYRMAAQPAVFYAIYMALMGVYFFSTLSIVDTVWHIRRSSVSLAIFIAGFFLIHSAGLRFALSRLIGAEQSFFFEEGAAGQRLLGLVLQPSSFAVFLVLSLALYLKHRPVAAIVSAVIAALFHPTYLLSAAVLVATYLLAALWENWPRVSGGWKLVQDTNQRWHIQADHSIAPAGGLGDRAKSPWPLIWRVIGMGLLALVLVAPMVYYVYVNFAGTPPETTAQARQILVYTRIPHHALISWWFNFSVVIKMGIIATALILIRRTRLFGLFLLPVLAAFTLTLVQYFIQNDALALIFPWRLSVWLYPVHVALLLGWLASRAADRLLPGSAGAAWAMRASAAVIGLTVIVGATRFTLDLQRQRSAPEQAMLAFLRANPQQAAVYLTPVKLQDFRLATGAPVFIDFKSIPYRDEDVLEWSRRFELADDFFHKPDCSALQSFVEQGVTHLVLPAENFSLDCSFMQPIFKDEHFGVFTLAARP